jgi:hypothetical protein
MKIYFDDIKSVDAANCLNLSKSDGNDFWLTTPATRLKRELTQMGIPYDKLDESSLTEPGLYFIEVNGDPIWWCGLGEGDNVPRSHVLELLPLHIVSFVKNKKLRIIISADREGGGMIAGNKDGFEATHNAMIKTGLSVGSVLILQGNKKIKEQYENWLLTTGRPKVFEVQYSNHFDRIFINNDLLDIPIIYESLKNNNVKDFNSLNRTFKSHRTAHLYILATQPGWLEKGIVTANELKFGDHNALKLTTILNENSSNFIKSQLIKEFDQVLKNHYPLHFDGDWSVNNAANFVNLEIFKNSLLSFVTETKFNEDVIFLTEKIFKCLTYGHPMIVLAPCGTLNALTELGYITDTCGINPNYNDIENDVDRFIATHNALSTWINFSLEEKMKRIETCLPAIEHNFKLSANRNFYHEDVLHAINISREYFQ